MQMERKWMKRVREIITRFENKGEEIGRGKTEEEGGREGIVRSVERSEIKKTNMLKERK